MGYYVRREFWGKGIATEIAVVIEHGRGLGLRRILAGTSPKNFGSIRVLEKAGFVEVTKGETFINFEYKL